METNKLPTLENYFTSDAIGENFFDQISTSGPSSMLNSLVQQSNEEEVTDGISNIQLENKLNEPVVCKIFADVSSPEVVSNDKTFFDILSPSEIENSSSTTGKLGSPLMDFDVNNEGPYPSPLQGFEAPSDMINGPETDRTREAWIPSDSTRKALIMAATSTPGSYTPDRHLLTMPGVVLDRELVDRLFDVIKKYFGEEEARKRKVPTMNDVPHDEKGLKELIQNHCFKAAINLTSKLLTPYGQGLNKQNHPSKHTPHTIQLWFTRLCLLVKLRLFDVAHSESNVWWDFDRPDLYYQFYPEIYGGKLGTMVPFQMRLLTAIIPAYTQNQHYVEAFDRLYSILNVVRQILKNLEAGKSEDGSPIELSAKAREMAKQVWHSREVRVQHSIINIALMSKHYVLAIEVLQSLINKSKSINQKRALVSALGRVFLQLGDVTNAEKSFTKAKQLKRNEQGTLSSDTADLRELVDRALLLVCENQHVQAYEYFQKASLLDPTNVMVINNMAFCLLYMGQLKNAIQTLISTIKAHPTTALHEALLLNLCTLFDLGSSDRSTKEILVRELMKFKGDGLNIDCLKSITKD